MVEAEKQRIPSVLAWRDTPRRKLRCATACVLASYLLGCGISAGVRDPGPPLDNATPAPVITKEEEKATADEGHPTLAAANPAATRDDLDAPRRSNAEAWNRPASKTSTAAKLDESAVCARLRPDRRIIEVTLKVHVGHADIIFLIDRTASMQEEINLIGNQLQNQLTPAVLRAIPDARVGVATFADFPIDPHGGSDRDDPFTLITPAVDDLAQVQAALDAIRLGDGMDVPESQVEALYQLATGDGLGEFIAPATDCPPGSLGYPCFRPDALPVILLFTDAVFHNGPAGVNAYPADLIAPPPHEYASAIRSMTDLNARVIGFDSGDGTASEHLIAVARDTGTVDATGRPLVFQIGRDGESLGRRVVEAIQSFSQSAVQDVSAAVHILGSNTNLEVGDVVEDLVALEAKPASGIQSIDRDARSFRGVAAGTVLTFEITLRDAVPELEPETTRVELEIVFRGDARRIIGRRRLEVGLLQAVDSGCTWQ